MKPFFSIIIPTYNRAYVIDCTIESVLAQTYTDWELIVVDDGSTDDTAIQMAKYNDLRIHYFQKVHAERSAARNYGLERANGKYVCFLDSDDEYLPNFLGLLYASIISHPEYKIFRAGTYLVKNGERIPLPFPDPSWSALEAICRNFNGFGSYCFVMEALDSFTFDERFNIGEDFHFVMRVAITIKKIYFIDQFGYCIIYNPKSEILYFGSTDNMRIKTNSFEDLLLNYQFPKVIRKSLVERLVILQLIILKTLRNFISLQHVKASIKAFGIIIRYPSTTFSILRR